MVRPSLGADGVGTVLTAGFHTTGEILLVTGVGGSLGAVIAESGMDKTLKDLFSADENAPVILSILLAWLIAAVLHFAIGSVSVGAITAAGIIAPIVGSLGVDPVVIALSIASGAMFALHVNSNFFWMFSTPARPLHQGQPEDPDDGDLARRPRLPPAGAGGQPGRRRGVTISARFGACTGVLSRMWTRWCSYFPTRSRAT